MLRFGLLFLIFAIPAGIEGAGLFVDRQLILWFYIALPALLYLGTLIGRLHFKIPHRLTVLALAYFVFSSISTVLYASDKEVSVERFLFSLALLLIFFFSYSNKGVVKKLLPPLIIILGLFFSLYSLAVHTAVFEKQVVYPFYGSHNHLGDYLGLVLIFMHAVMMKGLKRPIHSFVFILTFILMVLSFSRSAYLAFFLVTFLYAVRNHLQISRKALVAIFTGLSILLVMLFIASSRGISKDSPLHTAQSIAVKRFNLLPREIWSERDVYFGQALSSIRLHPWFGVGGGNFIKVSLTHNRNNSFTDSAHNILAETATEQGILALIPFIGIGVLLVMQALKNRTVEGYALLYLLLNFQTDYTYQIYFLLVFAALLAGVSYEEKESSRLELWAFGIPGVLLFLLFVFYLTSLTYLRMNMPLEAIKWYPLNKWAYIQAIREEVESSASNRLTYSALRIAPDDVGILITSAQNSYIRGDLQNSLAIYERLYNKNRLVNFAIIRNIYSLKKQLISKESADKFLNEVALNYREIIFVPSDFKSEFADFCLENRGKVCKETGWY